MAHGYGWLLYPAAAICLAAAVTSIFRQTRGSGRIALAVVIIGAIAATALGVLIASRPDGLRFVVVDLSTSVARVVN